MDKYVLNKKQKDKLETLSSKLEELRELLKLVNDFAWRTVAQGNEDNDDALEKMGCFTEMLVDLVKLREDELDSIIGEILEKE